MVSIIIILIVILILDLILKKTIIKMRNIEVLDPEKKYVNKLHKYGERILSLVNILIIVLAMSEYPHLRPLIFIGPGILVAYRTIMEWKNAKETGTYLISASTSGLFFTGSIVYVIIH
ncbi:protein of unknown function [Gracilibacillus ureilyticus]|uniref:DUF4181 domain-containing protein n=1 Tax=Gracilibacillus ureilyticus TaxID=531814 RepID=A0A1H9V8T3_9BACI|nr:DUF4181 domain-containing protein [Gracilibacillus ureilyticus]SES18186.1 protein of unknown function [Gracilibacillus ureilyticus]